MYCVLLLNCLLYADKAIGEAADRVRFSDWSTRVNLLFTSAADTHYSR